MFDKLEKKEIKFLPKNYNYCCKDIHLDQLVCTTFIYPLTYSILKAAFNQNQAICISMLSEYIISVGFNLKCPLLEVNGRVQ